MAPHRSQITEDQRREALRQVNRTSRRAEAFWQWAQSFVVAVGLFLVLRAFVVEAFKIPSGSMERTLMSGDFLLVNKMAYGAEVPFTGRHLPAIRAPQRGDVVVFRYPEEPATDFVKRLVGLPGDTLEMRAGRLYVNGALRQERYAVHGEPGDDPSRADFAWQRDFLVGGVGAAADYHPSRNNWGPLVVPEGNYFVLGDNRDNSLDSRYWGFVPDTLLRGRPMIVYYSYAPDTSRSFWSLSWLTRIRWHRLGEPVR